MKKFLLSLTAVLFSVILFAQEEISDGTVVNKHGIAVLPEAGDFALGVDASPFFNLVGNMVRLNDFTGPFSDPSSFDFVDGSSIYGKYFLTANTAVRVRLDIMMMSRTLNNFVPDDESTDVNATVTDTWKYSENGVNLGFGYEMRRGKGRLQAFYGGEVDVMFGGTVKNEFTWGNDINTNDTDPTTTVDFYSGATANTSFRVLDSKEPGGFGFGLRGFVGVEYFLFPNISFGGEFGWGFMLNSTGDGDVNSEFWNGTARETDNSKIAGSKGFNLGNDNMSGNIYMMFHF